MTHNLLTNILKKHGIEEYSPLNEKFDPNKHEAIVEVEKEGVFFSS